MTGLLPPVNPCGMAVDVLRSCYETEVRFYRDDPRTTRIRWYFTDAPQVPFPTCYGNRFWEAEQGEWIDERGEVSAAPRPWRNGRIPVQGGHMGAHHFCGTAKQWAGDISILDSHEADKWGRDPCCHPPPPVQARSGLQVHFRAATMVRATLGSSSLFLSSPLAKGRLPVRQGALLGVAPHLGGRGFLLGELSASGSTSTAYRSSHRLAVVLEALAGLHGSFQSFHAVHTSIAARGTLRPTAAVTVGLPAFVSSSTALLSSEEGIAQLTSILETQGAVLSQSNWAGHLHATVRTVASLLTNLQARGVLPVSLDLHAAVVALAKSKGVLLTKLQVHSLVKDILAGRAAELPGGKGKLAMSVSFAAFQMVTPSGSCGSLPASIVCRFSSGTTHYTTLNGHSATLTYSSLSQQWTGTVTTTDGTSNCTLACNTGNWALNMSGSAGNGTHQVIGTSGATPSLSGTLTLTGPGTGTILATITRT